MLQEEVYKIFEKMFPQYSEYVTEWFPNGWNSVRVKLIDKQEFAFTYRGEDDWCFETVESFVKKLEGGCGMNVRLYDSINS